jgi:hypothetical protein
MNTSATSGIARRLLVRRLTAGVASAFLFDLKFDLKAQAPAVTPEPERLQIGESELEILFAGSTLDLPKEALLEWVRQCATAVARYFGRFPVAKARVSIFSREGRQGVSGGRTWGDHGAHTRISIGQHTTVEALKRDWVLTHEFVHYGFPDMPDRNHWIEEGLATYVEPIARVAVGTQSAATAWFEMVRDMPKGQPQAGDEGLDNTHTWGRTYWGGAMFCLLADISIRKQTGNRKGLRDALQGIVAAGGSIEVSWPIDRALAVGDRAVGGKVLVSLYEEMSGKASPVDLTALWKELGVERQGDTAVFDDHAPLAAIRKSILS